MGKQNEKGQVNWFLYQKNTNLGIKIYQYFIDFKKLEFKFKLVLILISMVEMCNRKYQKKKKIWTLTNKIFKSSLVNVN